MKLMTNHEKMEKTREVAAEKERLLFRYVSRN
jgi:hypothetical protein